MNERIQELIKQSTTVEYGVDNGFDRVTFDKEKFAELIVRECANLNFRSTGHVTTDGEVAIGEMINKHFGVEE